jgi:ABC-type nitrate/sulfonate/bicarbonate transport system substrate-binding protein
MPLAPSLSPLLWAFALLLLSRSAGALAVAPCLLLLRGPLALALVAVAVGAALCRAGRRDPLPLRDPGAWPLFLAAAEGYFKAEGIDLGMINKEIPVE